MIANHTREIEYLRNKIAGLLHETPPKRKLATKYGTRLNRLIQLQLKRETIIERKQHEASRCHTSSPRVSLPSTDGGSPHSETMAAAASR